MQAPFLTETEKAGMDSDGKRKYISDSFDTQGGFTCGRRFRGKTVGARRFLQKYIYGFDQDIVDKVKDAVKGGASQAAMTLTIDAACRNTSTSRWEKRRAPAYSEPSKRGNIGECQRTYI